MIKLNIQLFDKTIYIIIFSLFFCNLNYLIADDRISTNTLNVNTLIFNELSSRHPNLNILSLVDIARGEDALLNELLKIRLVENPPQVGINAQKILLNFSNIETVREAFLEDVSKPDRFGLASVILSRIDEIIDEEFKLKLGFIALKSISNKNKSSFESLRAERYKALLSQSNNPKLKALIRD